MIDYKMRKLMKREKLGRALSVLLLLQCVIFTFVTLRIVLLGTIALTSLFYCNIRKTCKKLLIAYIYCAVVFVICSIYNQELEPLQFLGLKDRPDEIHRDAFFHERNTLYFAMLPNEHLKLKIDTFIEAFESKKFVNIKSDDLLTYILNLDCKKAYENMCIYHRGNTLVYVNGKIMPYEDTERNFYKSTVDELTKKQALLDQMGIESEKAILFSVYIPEYDSFWTEYRKFFDKEDMARYIVKNSGYLESLENANYECVIFSNSGEHNITYKQKNTFKMIVMK